ncbi:MAG TPA: hypothetical protein VMH03_05790, partial [Terriglobales bacterium]|nr:hypothetical protein [Terriglobales bacterium]
MKDDRQKQINYPRLVAGRIEAGKLPCTLGVGVIGSYGTLQVLNSRTRCRARFIVLALSFEGLCKHEVRSAGPGRESLGRRFLFNQVYRAGCIRYREIRLTGLEFNFGAVLISHREVTPPSLAGFG